MASGRPIEIPIVVNADGAEKGASNVADAFDEIEDSLKSVAKVGDKTSKSLEDDMSDAAKKIDRDLTKALDDVSDQAKSTGKTVGREVKSGTDKAGEGFSELKDESKSTAKEAAASFGSIEDAADALQEVAANAFAGFGPAGMAAGALAAVGIGLAISALQDNADKINENKDKIVAMAQAIKDNGGVLRESDYIKAMEDYGYSIVDTKEFLDIFQADAITGFERMSELSQQSGIDLNTAFRGSFGSVKESQKGLDEVNKKLTALKDKKEAVYNTTGSILDPVDTETLSSLEDLKGKMETNIRNQRIADEMEKARKRSIEGTTQALKENIEAIEKQTDATKGSITSELDYLDSVDSLSTKLTDSSNAWDINTAAGRDNQRAVVDIANGIEDMAKASIDAGGNVDEVTAKFNAQKDALINQVAPAFGGSKEAARLYIEQILKTPTETKTTVKLEGESTVRAALDRLAAPVSVWLKPEAPTETYFQSVLSQMANRSVPVSLTPRLGQGNGN